MTNDSDFQKGLVGRNDHNNERKDIAKNMSKRKTEDTPKSFLKYPTNIIYNKENKIYVSLNATSKREAMDRDCQIGEVYMQLKEMMQGDMRFFGSIILGLVNRYATDYSTRAKDSNHQGIMDETHDILDDFCYNLGFYKDGLIPLHMKGIDTNLIKEKEGEIEQTI